ncbi:MAG: replicative DNA helicase [Treponema sp.]|nr:replicative DNA helicase [Treponema sp.]MDY3758552.1 replicative DNA helicase [Treponema sp.]MDY4130564.1 replicative DNA helicase [Treponema sp.]MDY5838896.1 replicative DNA helicase [Treponema sp.]
MDLKDKIPPHNLEAEKATLGALLLDWTSINEVVQYLRKDNFYSQQNQLIYESLLNLFSKGTRGDLLTLIDDLTKSGNLEKAGGTAYITSLTDSVPTSANVDYYAKIVLDQSTRRNLIKISSEIKADSYDETKESRSILEEVEQKVFKLTDTNQTTKVMGMDEIIPKTINIIDARFKNKNAFSGIASGITKLDSMTSGFQKSEMIIVGARPSMGKTALAMSMMENIAINKKIPCGFFSLEMSADQIGQRLLSQVARIQGTKLKSGLLKFEDFKKLQDAAGECFNAPLYIVDTPNMKLLDLRAMARRMRVNQKVEIIFIDYIGLITPENTEAPLHEQQSMISKSLKSLARELEIPIVVLCQVARSAEGNEPGLAELRGSGSIEQDADMVMFIHGDRSKNKETNEGYNPVQDRTLIVAKQRNGPIGDVKVRFFSNYTKFENAADDDQE